MFDKGERATDVTPVAPEAPSAHPLARALATDLQRGGPHGNDAGAGRGRRVLLLGVGSGRNVPALLAAGLRVDAVESDPARALAATTRFADDPHVRIARSPYTGPLPFSGPHAGALSTHALLHGTLATIAASIVAARDRLGAGAPFYATLGSTRDPRFGTGRRLAAATFAPTDGSECGVAHSYVDESGARALFAGFVIEALDEARGGEHVGAWAHEASEAETIVHWYVRARHA